MKLQIAEENRPDLEMAPSKNQMSKLPPSGLLSILLSPTGSFITSRNPQIVRTSEWLSSRPPMTSTETLTCCGWFGLENHKQQPDNRFVAMYQRSLFVPKNSGGKFKLQVNSQKICTQWPLLAF